MRRWKAAGRRGLLVGRGGVYGNVLRIAPPLSVTAAEIEEAAAALTESLVEVDAAPDSDQRFGRYGCGGSPSLPSGASVQSVPSLAVLAVQPGRGVPLGPGID